MYFKTLINIFQKNFSSLTKNQAEIRSHYIKKNSIDYIYHLTLHKGTSYDGLTSIIF